MTVPLPAMRRPTTLSALGYLRQLHKRWGVRSLVQALKMYRFHRVPFETLLTDMFGALDTYAAKFAFPIVALVARMRPDLVQMIEREGHEVASHGFNHLRYPNLTPQAREEDIVSSLAVFESLGVRVRGFRAPYNNYTDDMPLLLDRVGILWDGGFGYRPEHRGRHMFFHVNHRGRRLSTTFIPLNAWSDDRMIDTDGMGPSQITRRLVHEVTRVADLGGVIMFDFHPVRFGQPQYVGCLARLVEEAHSLGGWCPTPAEAVEYWGQHGRWPGDARFCLLLTGDIDNWVFSDYLRRVIWARQARHLRVR